MAAEIPADVATLWQSLDPAVRAALIESESKSSDAADAKSGLQGRRAKASTGPRMDDTTTNLIGGASFEKRSKNPEWIKVRADVYDAVKEKRQAELDTKSPVDITVTLPDGKTLSEDKEGNKYQAWRTTPFDVAATISRGLADSASVARVTYVAYVEDYNPEEDGMGGVDTLSDAMADLDLDDKDEEKSPLTVLWDMTRPLVGSISKLEFLKFEDDVDARTVFWHSSAHVMGEALERLYGSRLTIGPPLAGGFYYDSYMGEAGGDGAFKEDDCECLYKQTKRVLACYASHMYSLSFSWMLTNTFLQTSQSKPKSKKSSKRNKNLNASS
jgi:threonyl-tRNA synthetase